MTVIYVDTLFLLNAIVDYLLLLGAARLAGEPLRRMRFLAGALLGGGYAVALFLPGLGFLAHPLCRAACAALMLLISYGGSRRLLRQGVIFLALTCAFGGGVMAIGLLHFRDAVSSQVNLQMAGATIVILPMLIFYLVFRKQIIEGVSRGGIKG